MVLAFVYRTGILYKSYIGGIIDIRVTADTRSLTDMNAKTATHASRKMIIKYTGPSFHASSE